MYLYLGQTVDIPRPVDSLRIWNIKTRKYDIISAHLYGAPNKNDAKKYWNEMIKNLKIKFGNEYIDNLMK